MWTEYFNFIKLRRGRVITPSHGEIDFSRDDIPVEVCKELLERGFPYLELTELGRKDLYQKSSILAIENAQIRGKNNSVKIKKKVSLKEKK